MSHQTPQLIRMAKWMRKSTIGFFERNPDAIAVPGFIPLGNKIVINAISTGFEVLSRDSFFITCRAREILTENVKGNIVNETDIFQAESSLNTMFERVHEYFDARIKQGEQKLEFAGFGLTEITRHTANYETRSVTNAATQYIDVLAKADMYLAVLQYLWLTGELADNPDDAMRHKLNAERDVRQQLFNIIRVSNGHYNNIRRICNGVLELRRTEREAQAAKDRSIAKRRSKKAAVTADKDAARQDAARKKRAEKKQRDIAHTQLDMDVLAPA